MEEENLNSANNQQQTSAPVAGAKATTTAAAEQQQAPAGDPNAPTAEDLQFAEQAAEKFSESSELQNLLLGGIGVAAVAVIILTFLIIQRRRSEARALETFTDDESSVGKVEEDEEEEAKDLAGYQEDESPVPEIKKKR